MLPSCLSLGMPRPLHCQRSRLGGLRQGEQPHSTSDGLGTGQLAPAPNVAPTMEAASTQWVAMPQASTGTRPRAGQLPTRPAHRGWSRGAWLAEGRSHRAIRRSLVHLAALACLWLGGVDPTSEGMRTLGDP